MDEQLTCVDCRTSFNFTAGEQAFYSERGYQKPRRCKSCRAQRKAANAPSVPSVPTVTRTSTQWTNGESDVADRHTRRRAHGHKHGRRDHSYE